MFAIFSLLLIVSLSILITRIATVMLTHTGLSREVARFQARSAFSGVGFTTSEAEYVVGHPVRRKILMALMLLGNAGIVTAMSSFILGFLSPGGTGDITLRMLFLSAGILVIMLLASSRWLDHHLSNLISWALKRYTRLDVQDYASLMHLAGQYSITEVQVEGKDWMAEKTLAELDLRDEGIMVLGINRAAGMYVGTPDGKTAIFPNDTLILYGRSSVIEKLDRRRRGKRGDTQHDRAVREQEQVSEDEKRKDPEEAMEPPKKQERTPRGKKGAKREKEKLSPPKPGFFIFLRASFIMVNLFWPLPGGHTKRRDAKPHSL